MPVSPSAGFTGHSGHHHRNIPAMFAGTPVESTGLLKPEAGGMTTPAIWETGYSELGSLSAEA
jgi:hypothetical protein